ncbi:hypothetical protein BGZ79_001822, partial [Entomortierella chlamydospora]
MHYKVLRGRVSPTKDISSQGQYDATKGLFLRHTINTSRVTHEGRHSGALEVERLGVAPIDIAAGVQWMVERDKMGIHYLSRLPVPCTKAMTGFKDRSFYLPWNRADLPLDLQRQILPWVESQIGTPGSPEREEWTIACIQEMNEVNEDDTESFERIETPKKINKDGYQTTSVVKRGFLELLVRCRRVILQAQDVQEMESLEDNRLRDIENIIPRIADEIRTTRGSIGVRQDTLLRDNSNQRQNMQEIERRLEFSERML